MPRNEQMERQWRIMQILLSSRRGKTVAELAERFECHARTIYRDMEALQLSGFPLNCERKEGVNRWALDSEMREKIPVPFSLTELMALYFGRDMMKVFRDTVFYDSIDSLYEKIKATLPPGSIAYLERIKETFSISLKPYETYGRYRDTISRVKEAAINRVPLIIEYYTMSRGKRTRRRVDPYKIFLFNGSFYLVAYCHLREGIRIFSMERIRELEEIEGHFTIPEDFSMEDLLGSSFGLHHGRKEQVKIRFAPSAAGYIEEKVWHENQKITLMDDGHLIFDAEVAGTEEIKRWIMSWGERAEVLAPVSLRKELKAELAGVLELYND